MSAKFTHHLDALTTAAIDGTAQDLINAINAAVNSMTDDSRFYIVPLLSAIHVIDYDHHNHLMTMKEGKPIIQTLDIPAKHYLAFALSVASISTQAANTPYNS